MKNVLVLLFVLAGFQLFAQPAKAETEIVNGKKYYVHIVQGGNTLYGIHNLYNVPVEEIIAANPGSEKGLFEGQKLIIPVPQETIIHEVQAKETLFGISKKYGVTVDDIVAANPELKDGLKVGQKITIPGVSSDVLTGNEVKSDVKVPVASSNENAGQVSGSSASSIKVTFTDSIIQHQVLDHETMYSISKRYMVSTDEIMKLNNMKSSKIKPGEIIKIPVKKEKIEQVKVRQVQNTESKQVDSTILFPKRSTYNIALLLPFFLDKQDANSTLSTLATEFYMGAQLAIDSLEKLGLKSKVYVFDSVDDTLAIKKVLSRPEFGKMDLIIGPFYPDNADYVARWCKVNKVRHVCPASVNSSTLSGNPYVYAAVPSDATLMKGMASYLLKNEKDATFILVKPADKDKALYDAFRGYFMSLPVSGTRSKLTEATLDNYTSFLKKGVKTILIYPTTDKFSAVKFMNALNATAGKFNPDYITVYGTKEWVNFDDVKPIYKEKYHFHYAGPNNFSYKDENLESLHRLYRSEYNADISKMAVQGFDVTYYFVLNLLMGKPVKSEVMNQFEMKQKGKGNGYENEHVFILKQVDYDLIDAEGSNE